MKKNIFDYLLTTLIFSIFFFENNMYVNYFGVFLFFTAILGSFNSLILSLKEVVNVYSWEDRIPSLIVKFVILSFTKFWPIGLIYLLTEIVLSVKKIIGDRIYSIDLPEPGILIDELNTPEDRGLIDLLINIAFFTLCILLLALMADYIAGFADLNQIYKLILYMSVFMPGYGVLHETIYPGFKDTGLLSKNFFSLILLSILFLYYNNATNNSIFNKLLKLYSY